MPSLVFIQPDGSTRTIDAPVGSTVMENAVRNGVAGIEAECGGACACATCHVYVEPDWVAVVGAPQSMEEDMLDFAVDVGPTSRLSCQIKLTAAMDGLTIRIPARQA